MANCWSARVSAGRRQDPGRSTGLRAVAGHPAIGRPRRGAPAGERRDRPAAALRARWRDIDADGCADIVIPLAWIGCGSRRRGPDRAGSTPARSDWSVRRRIRACSSRQGSIGFRTRAAPVGPVAGRGRRARGLADRFVGALRARRSPTDRDHVGIERRRRAAAASTGPLSQDGVTSSFGWPPGTRLLVRASPVTETIPASHSSLLTDPAAFLHTDVLDGEFSGLIVPGSLGTDGGGTPSSTSSRYDLRSTVVTPEGTPVESWIVTAAALDATGTLSDPVQASASIDTVAPVGQPRRSAAEPAVAVRHRRSMAEAKPAPRSRCPTRRPWWSARMARSSSRPSSRRGHRRSRSRSPTRRATSGSAT